jgi:predicted lactoylglutathione lyase
MIMVAAKDIGALQKFYEAGLGWKPWAPATPSSIMYKVGHSLLVFLNADYLAAERGEPIAAGSQASLAVFVESKEKVDELFAKATSAVRDRDGGLYTGYFVDPEGNSWEVVWSPAMPLDSDGALTLPTG